MSAAILPRKKLLLLFLSGIGAALFWKIGAMTNATDATNARQNGRLNPVELPGAADGYGQKKDTSDQKCCDKPPSKSALMLAR
jgi:hypothetical protein